MHLKNLTVNYFSKWSHFNAVFLLVMGSGSEAIVPISIITATIIIGMVGSA